MSCECSIKIENLTIKVRKILNMQIFGVMCVLGDDE